MDRKNGEGMEYPNPDDFEYLLELKIDFVDETEELPAFWKFSGKLFPEKELTLPRGSKSFG